MCVWICWSVGLLSDEEEKKEEEDGEEEDEELGGLFRVLKQKSEAGKEQKYNANLRDSSKFPVDAPHDWQMEEVSLVFHCYVFVSCCFLIVLSYVFVSFAVFWLGTQHSRVCC